MDIAILEWIASNRPESLKDIILLISKIGTEAAPIVLLCLTIWCFERRYRAPVLLTIMLSIISNQLLKLIFAVPRPWLRSSQVTPVEAALPGATGYSFPSGHTSNAAACAGAVSLLTLPRAVKALAWIAALLVGMSRLYLCVHTPSDVIVGFLLSVAVMLLVKKLIPVIESRPAGDIMIAIACALLSGLSILLACIRPDNGTNSLLDTMKLGGASAGALSGWLLERRLIKAEAAKDIKRALLRVLPGLALTALMLKGTKPLFNGLMGQYAGSIVRYMLTVLTATCVWPFIYTKAGF